MTAIVGVVHEGTVVLGGDSAGVSGYALTVRADPKVFTNGDFAFGFTSSFRMGDLLRYAFTPPTLHTDDDLDRYMRTTFIDAVRACLREAGWTKTDAGREEGGTFLVGVRGHLYRVDSDFQVGEAADGFDAVGCGAEVALGALHATSGQPPEDRLQAALAAAERMSAGVRGPFTLVALEART